MASPWQVDRPRFKNIEAERDVPCRLADKTELLADVYRPAGDGPWPVLLMRIPYDKTQAQTVGYAHPSWYARFGYLVVVQDCRGRWSSGGRWHPFVDEAADGQEAIDWAAGLKGSDGRVAMYGFSYGGATQLLPAVRTPKNLDAIVPAFTASDYFEGWTYKGGQLCHAITQFWATLLAADSAHRLKDTRLEEQIVSAQLDAQKNYWKFPQNYAVLREHEIAPYYYDWLINDRYNEYWSSLSVRSRYGHIDTPALHIGGWYDIFREGTLENYTGLSELARTSEARTNQKLVMGPWYHCPWHSQVGALDFGEQAGSCIDDLQILWFDYILKGEPNQINEEPPVALFVMGENKWRFEDEWPLKRAEPVSFFLHSRGRANSLNGNGKLDRHSPADEFPDIFTYDPRQPVITVGGNGCCDYTQGLMGAYDQRSQECRNDVLVYTSDVMGSDLEVTGTVEIVLFAASTAVDTDFTAKLVDVHPDGTAYNICDGILRTSYRDSMEQPSHIEPDRVYEYRFSVGSTANVFKAGHRVRLEIASSNFPVYARNSNSGKRLAETTSADWQVATQTVFHDGRYPSHLVLPVVPAE